MWRWETPAQKAERETNDALAGCLGPVFLIFFVLALIGHFFTKAGDMVYYPIVQNWPFTEERKVETWLRDVFGHSFIRNIPNKEPLLSFFSEDSQRARIVSDVQKIDDRFYGARLFLDFDSLPRQYDQLLRTWKEDQWRRENLDRLFIENVRFNTVFLKKDLERDEKQPIFAYLLSNGRITINKQFSALLNDKDEYWRGFGKKGLEQLRSKFRLFKANLPPGWEKRSVDAPDLKRLSDWNFNQLIIPLGVLLLVMVAIRRYKNS